MVAPRRLATLLLVLAALGGTAPAPALANERELERDTAPTSAEEIEAPLQGVFPEEVERPPLFPWFRRQLQKLPPFFADTELEVRYRTYYLRADRTDGRLSEAWAMGGSIRYVSGWLAELFRVEVEGFTSQPIVAPDGRDNTLLLEQGQEGYTVLGIANGQIRWRGLQLTGGRHFLGLPYVNRQDNRMTPNTFEGLVLAVPEGKLRFSLGYDWRVKLRNSRRFETFTEALGFDEDRGLAHGGIVWDPTETVHLGAIAESVPDLFAGVYAEGGVARKISDEVQLRFDGQFTYQWDIGDDLLGELLDDTWSLGVRASTSYAGAVFRLGGSFTGASGRIVSFFGANPSYVDLMQRTFTATGEKALLASVSYDFSRLGVKGLSGIMNFVAAFEGEPITAPDEADNAFEVDLTFDYKVESGWLETFWLRLRGSWLREEQLSRDGYDVRAILRYDFPVL